MIYLKDEEFGFADQHGTFVSLEGDDENIQRQHTIRGVNPSLDSITQNGATKTVRIGVVQLGSCQNSNRQYKNKLFYTFDM